MITARRFVPVGAALTLGACASGLPPGPAALVVPGSGKDLAAFQLDDTICRLHAAASPGYGDRALLRRQGSTSAASGSTDEAGTARATAGTTIGVGTAARAPAGSGTIAANASSASTAEPPDETVPNQAGYLHCMAARGDTVLPEPSGYAEAANWYGYAYSYDYPYPYPYSYGYPYGFYDGAFVGVFGGGFHRRDFHRRFFHQGDFHRGFLHEGGFHGGGFRGGGFHGGSFHGGGGHR